MIWQIDDAPKPIAGLDASGRADPDYARALGLLPAPGGRRALATLVEAAVAIVILLPAVLLLVPVAVAVAGGSAVKPGVLLWPLLIGALSTGLMSAYVIVQLVLHGRRGVTLGKAVCGLRSVNVRTLERPGFWRGAVVRYLVLSASLLLPLVGPVLVIALSPLFDPERRGRGWPDLAAATWFVDVRRGLNPYDVKRMRIARKSVQAPPVDERAPLPSLATPRDRDAPRPYVPASRLSGGVIGAHRAAAPTTSASPAAIPAPEPGASPAPPAGDAATPRHPAPATETGDVRATVALEDGTRVQIRGLTLFGRAPSAAPGEAGAHLVSVADPDRSISKTHVAIVPARRGVFVVDRASTNGSALIRAGGEITLPAGEPVELRVGDVLRFGDRTLTVEIL